MAVLQLPKEKATKDGRRWYFYDKIKVDGRTKPYMSKSYMTRNEALRAERDFLVGFQAKEINVLRLLNALYYCNLVIEQAGLNEQFKKDGKKFVIK